MSQLERAGQSGALDVATSQAAAKAQIATMLDMLRQLGGDPSVVAGAGGSADPLNAPFTLYVDPYIGSDRFVGGAYNSYEATGTDEQIIAQKLKRIELQRLECGYTKARPFKTINRAAIEAAIITSKNWYTYSDPRAHTDCVTIVLSGGLHIVLNDPGNDLTSLASWGTAKDPTISELIAFNPVTGGVLLPRGCSMHGQDLRKTSVRPTWVPAVADELADYSNRRAIFKVSGTGFFFNATTMDKIGHAQSVHLLDTFQPASQAELNAFYLKVQSTVGTGADLATALLAARPSEYQIVGPIDQTLSPTSAWDTTTGASPYIFNWSVRSEYGMGGAFWDGAKLSGLRSMVCANFTGTGQQKDMRCWQVYQSGAWVSLPNTPEGYQQYISATPDNVRRNPLRHTRHVSAVNNAYIQKVSIFGIGQSEVTMVDSGGEITDNGGNSTFGGCSALAKGYKGFSFAKDRNWTVSKVRAPLNISEKLSNIRRIEIGVVAAISGSTITLTTGLAIDAASATNPELLQSLGYSFASGTRIWIDNPAGADWRATLSSSAWNSSTPAAIGITAAPLQSGTNEAAGSDAIGRRVYLRRVVDTRTVAERRCSLILFNTATASLPQRNVVLQTDPARSGGAIGRVLAGGGEEVLLVTNVGVGPVPGAGVVKTSEVSLRRGAASKTYASGTYYRQGTVVKHAGKHWQAKATFISSGGSPDLQLWGEAFVHMPTDFNPEDSVNQEAPILTLDTDTSDADASTTLGINWTTAWTDAGAIRDQYRTGTDYLGAYALLRALGFADAAAHAALVPQVAASRDRDPSSATAFPTPPSGGAATGLGNWAVEFRRPSTIRLYNHQWEWAGFGNYSKAIPAVQGDMSEFNKFTYYFTSAAGGRVVPKGSNEDGFEVTPRGLEDIATGATIGTESLAGQSIDEAQQTDYPNGIQVGGTASLQDVSISGNIDFSSQSQAKTTRTGVTRLASIAQLTATGSNAPVATTDASLEASPDAVTIAGLNRWKQAQRLLSLRTDVTILYVVPDSATAAGQTFNFDGTSATLTLSPVRSAAEVSDAPPLTGATAVTFATAVAYANAVFSQFETVRYQLANGPYWVMPAAFNHIADVVGATARFPATNVVASYTTANTKPTTDVKALHDARGPFLIPLFATGLAYGPDGATGFVVNSTPLQLNFVPYGGGCRGVGWASLLSTIRDTANFPSTIFQVFAPYRSGSATIQSVIDDYIDASVPTGYNMSGFFNQVANILVAGESFYARDLVLGPRSAGAGGPSYGGVGCYIMATGNTKIYSGGIYFLGNSRLTTLPKAAVKGVSVTTRNTYGTKNVEHYIATSGQGRGIELGVFFNVYAFTNPSPTGLVDRNLDCNCMHVLDDNGNYGLMSNRAATDGTRGASMGAMIGLFNQGSTLYTGGFNSWALGFTNTNKNHGMAGTFGNLDALTYGPSGTYYIPGNRYVRDLSYSDSVWQMATSGALLTSNATLTYAPGQSQTAYTNSSDNPLNLVVQAFYKGVDVTTATTVTGSISSNRFFG
jgi:hypothetical protein